MGGSKTIANYRVVPPGNEMPSQHAGEEASGYREAGGLPLGDLRRKSCLRLFPLQSRASGASSFSGWTLLQRRRFSLHCLLHEPRKSLLPLRLGLFNLSMLCLIRLDWRGLSSGPGTADSESRTAGTVDFPSIQAKGGAKRRTSVSPTPSSSCRHLFQSREGQHIAAGKTQCDGLFTLVIPNATLCVSALPR